MVTISNTYLWKRRKTRIKEEHHGWCWNFSDVGATKQSDRPSFFSLYPTVYYRVHKWQDRTYIEYSPLRPDDILVTSLELRQILLNGIWMVLILSSGFDTFLDGIDIFEWFLTLTDDIFEWFLTFWMIFWPPPLELVFETDTFDWYLLRWWC